MKYRTLGRTGYEVSEIGLGCWQLGGDFGPLDDARSTAILDEAERQDINFWDTADVYGSGLSEERIGSWLRQNCGTAGHRRPLIATKVGRHGELYPDGYTKPKVRANLEGSLQRLGVESLDLAQLHCVPREVLQAGDLLGWMTDFQQDGLLRHVGASVETLEEAMFCLDQPCIDSLQIIFNLFRQDPLAELLPKAQKKNVGIIVRLPLASGLLGGKLSSGREFAPQDHRNYNRDGASFSVGETFSGIPFEKGLELVANLKQLVPGSLPLNQFALKWILDHPAVSTVIAGTSRPAQVAENAATSDVQCTLDDELRGSLATFYSERVRPHVRGRI